MCVCLCVSLCECVRACVRACACAQVYRECRGDGSVVSNTSEKLEQICPFRQGKGDKPCLSWYQERLQELEGQMAVKEKELQRLKAELEAIDSDRARTEEEKKKMRAAFEEKVEAVQRHMVQLQKQLREGEAAKVGHPVYINKRL